VLQDARTEGNGAGVSAIPISHSPAGAVRTRVEGLALMLLLAASLALRIHGISFGLPAINDPDELTFGLGAARMLRTLSLNPGWFGHPATTTMYVLAVIFVAVFVGGFLAGSFGSVHDFATTIYLDPSWIMLPGRVAMALFAVGTIYLTWRLASELFDRRTAFAAAALLAVNPVHVTWSQIIRSDMMACFFMLLCLRAALRIAREDRWRDYVLAALWVGAAMATKWPYALSALSVFGAVALRAAEHPAQRRRGLVRLVLFGAMAMGFLFAISPYLLLDHATALRNMRGEAQIRHLGATGGAPWVNAWWYLSGPVWTGLGAAGLALAAWGLGRVARRCDALVIVVPPLAGFFVVLCLQHLVWERWALALMPLLAIAGGAGLSAVAAWLAHRLPPKLAGPAAALLVVAALLPPMLRAEADSRARLNDTRQLASRWVRAHVPAGRSIMVEHFAFDMVPLPHPLLFPIGDVGCVDARALLEGKVQLGAIEAARGGRSNVDYGTLAPAKRDTCRPDYAVLSQYDRYAAERAMFPAEYAAYRSLLARGTVVAIFAPQDGRIAGPVVRIVRFAR
jgi:4-amino-4-deoxy-L-arabinose transferase-like glycosyltransferase